MSSIDRSKIKNAYKNRVVTGGVYCVECSGNGRRWVNSSVDLEGIKNRFEFAVKINSAPDPSMRREWEQYGIESFSFTVLEEIKKEETQSSSEFAADVKTLHELYLENNKEDK